MKFVAGAIFLVFGALVFAPSAPAAPLSKSEIEQLVTGARVPFTSTRGNPGYWYFENEGRFHGEIESPMGLIRDSGRWWVEPNGLFCRQYEFWRGGQKMCVFLVPEGSAYRTLEPDGKSRDHIWTVER